MYIKLIGWIKYVFLYFYSYFKCSNHKFKNKIRATAMSLVKSHLFIFEAINLQKLRIYLIHFF